MQRGLKIVELAFALNSRSTAHPFLWVEAFRFEDFFASRRSSCHHGSRRTPSGLKLSALRISLPTAAHRVITVHGALSPPV
jgi:hypothetical protein